MRPLWATWFLFGHNAHLREYEYLKTKRKKKEEREQFGFV
jgi:hypothetical protein